MLHAWEEVACTAVVTHSEATPVTLVGVVAATVITLLPAALQIAALAAQAVVAASEARAVAVVASEVPVAAAAVAVVAWVAADNL